MFAAIRGASLRVISLVAFRRPGSSSKYTHASAIASPHDVTGGSTFPLVQKRKPVWNAPMLNQPTVFEAAHIEYIEINGFAAAYSLTRARIRTQILSPDSTYSSMLRCSPSTIPVSPLPVHHDASHVLP
jgi:hypothetical protein